MSNISLAEQWSEFKEQNPKVRIRDAATQLKTTELELVATSCGKGNTRLKPDFKNILERLEGLGSLMALTRSEHVVHEAHGIYQDMKVHGAVAMFFNPGIDTRFFLSKWFAVYAVNENKRHSLQFFDNKGTAVHKVYVTDESNEKAYFVLIEEFESDNQEANESLPSIKEEEVGLKDIDPTYLRERWLKIRDVHEGNKLIKEYAETQRNEVYSALGEEYAKPLAVDSVEKLLEIASEKSVEIMLFAMNDAAVQAYSGPVKKLMTMGPWFNVLDPDFNLHLRTSGIHKVWMIRKPSDDGWVTTLSVIEKGGTEIMVIADNRKRGESESSQWQTLCSELKGL
ncbi:MAG TPA: hemin-degrading factor [Leucothrix sp.]|nr:hemin-degrading factor [Leucothrix sp.]